MRKKIVAVIGAGEAGAKERTLAFEVGERIAKAGFVLLTGGLGGVMEEASRGAREAGGTVLAIVPQADPEACNLHVDISVATGMGDARNAIIANTADAFIAIAGSYGTLSEIAFVLKREKPIVGLNSWPMDELPKAGSAGEAVESIKRQLESR